MFQINIKTRPLTDTGLLVCSQKAKIQNSRASIMYSTQLLSCIIIA